MRLAKTTETVFPMMKSKSVCESILSLIVFSTCSISQECGLAFLIKKRSSPRLPRPTITPVSLFNLFFDFYACLKFNPLCKASFFIQTCVYASTAIILMTVLLLSSLTVVISLTTCF